MEHPGTIFKLPAGPADFAYLPRDNGAAVDPSNGKDFVVNKVVEECFARAKAETVAILRRRIEEIELEAVMDILEGGAIFDEASGQTHRRLSK
jgi:hypothetical protein